VGIDREKSTALSRPSRRTTSARTYSPNLTETLFQRIPGVSTSDQQGNSFQTDIRYRGSSPRRCQGSRKHRGFT